MSKETDIPIEEILARDELDRGAIEELRRRALTGLKDRTAIEQFAASLASASQASARQKRGVALAVLGRHEEAVPVLEAAQPSSPARLLLGQCYRELGHFEKAAAVLRGLNPDGWTRFEIDMELASTASAAGRVDEAMAALEAHRGQAQEEPEYHFQFGCAREAAGDREGAAQAYQAALDCGDHAEAAFRLGRLADLYGDDELARASYERCLKGASLYVNALINLGMLLEDAGDYLRASECYGRALRLDPTNERARMFLQDTQASTTMYIDEDMQRRADRRNQVLETPVTDFELSVRSRNCLQKMGVRTLGDLAQCTESELLTYKNFGETSLREIKTLLTSKGLHLGMGREAEVAAGRRARSPAAADSGLLARPGDELELSVRGRNCLQHLQVRTVGELVECTEAELLACKNFGQTSLNEIKTKLAELGLTLREP